MKVKSFLATLGLVGIFAGNVCAEVFDFESLTVEGDVGIGTSEPQAKLHVKGNIIAHENGLGRVYLRGNESSGINAQGYIGHDTWDNLVIKGDDNVAIKGDGGGTIAFFKWNGYVGIGTTNPFAKLHVNKKSDNSESVGMMLQNNGGENSSVSLYLSAIYPGGNPSMRASVIKSINAGGGNEQDLAFLTSKRSNMPSEKMRITNNGKVGIGSDKPDTMLHIKSTEANAAITLERDDVEGESWELRSTFGGPHNYARFTIFNQNNDSDYLTILESGNVGIGVNEPKATLDIDGFVKMKPNSSEPVTCDEDHFGSMALTVKAQMCVCADNNQWELMNAGGALCNWEGKKETGEMCREDSECLNENCAFSYFSGFPQGFAVYTCQ